jgi:hypothetical protein
MPHRRHHRPQGEDIMSEVLRFNSDPSQDPLLDAADRISWDNYSRAMWGLLSCDGLTREGLEHCRNRLRDQEWRGARANIVGQHAVLLDAVCRALAATYGDAEADMLDYYAGSNDLLESVPDTLEGLA